MKQILPTQTLTHQEVAFARSRLYTLCQQLYLDGLTEQTLAVVMALPDLATQFSLPAAEDTEKILDHMAAAHQELFGFNLFPYESIFLESTGLLNGEVSEQVVAAYHAVGYEPPARAGAPDHLGEELGALAHLCAAEADAWEDGSTAIARRMQREQQHFLQRHLLRWLAPCVTAIQRHENRFFADLSLTTTDLVAAHYAALVAQATTAVDELTFAWALPVPPPLLDETHTSLKDIAQFLNTPVYSGVFLSRALINRLGRAQRLPRGFGSREQMLTNLLRTAAQYEALPTLLAELAQELLGWQQAYKTLWATEPLWAIYVQPWLARTGETIVMLQQIDEIIALAGENS